MHCRRRSLTRTRINYTSISKFFYPYLVVALSYKSLILPDSEYTMKIQVLFILNLQILFVIRYVVPEGDSSTPTRFPSSIIGITRPPRGIGGEEGSLATVGGTVLLVRRAWSLISPHRTNGKEYLAVLGDWESLAVGGWEFVKGEQTDKLQQTASTISGENDNR